MKKTLLALAVVAVMAACGTGNGRKASKEEPQEPKVMARYVPERMDDFVWENNLVCYRVYGEKLEGNPTSPGFDIWVKLPGKLVADDWYKAAQEDGGYYHHDHGGKDCYKVAVSLGGGASSPFVDGRICYPETNYRSYDILSQSDDEVSFVLHYPAWNVGGKMVSLDKKITVMADTYFCTAEDTYTGDFEELPIAVGIFTHDVESSDMKTDRFAVWEHASDQSAEPEDGMIGVAFVVPGAEQMIPSLEDLKPHAVAVKTVRSGEPLTYSFGSCWSKGDIKTAADWFALVGKI